MTSDFAEAIKLLQQERGISEELVLKTIEDFLLAAYKRKFGTSDNAVVRFNDDMSDVEVYAKKMIVAEDDHYDPVSEIVLEEAKLLNDESEIGDEILIKVDKREFDRGSVQSAKQRARQDLREIQKNTLYSEYKDKIGEIIIGYFQRQRNQNIFVDIGKTEAILPRRFQSPREVYRAGDRIKAMISEVNKTSSGLQIVLTRTHTDFVKKIFELEVPEIYDGIVSIERVVREPGYRTKIAVSTKKSDIDPVGACVGLKGVRIQSIVRELEGEKIDILKYDTNEAEFIKNALSPAHVSEVLILDSEKKHALAIVPEDQLSLAIGKQGLNVRLANRLVDWNIDVKTEEQRDELDISPEASRMASEIFATEEIEEISSIAELPGISERLVALLKENGIELIETLVSMRIEELHGLDGLTDEDIDAINNIIEENVEIVESEESEEEAEAENEEEYVTEEVEEYECPECGASITVDMTSCPNCGIGISFEIEEDESVEDSQ